MGACGEGEAAANVVDYVEAVRRHFSCLHAFIHYRYFILNRTISCLHVYISNCCGRA